MWLVPLLWKWHSLIVDVACASEPDVAVAWFLWSGCGLWYTKHLGTRGAEDVGGGPLGVQKTLSLSLVQEGQ